MATVLGWDTVRSGMGAYADVDLSLAWAWTLPPAEAVASVTMLAHAPDSDAPRSTLVAAAGVLVVLVSMTTLSPLFAWLLPVPGAMLAKGARAAIRAQAPWPRRTTTLAIVVIVEALLLLVVVNVVLPSIVLQQTVFVSGVAHAFLAVPLIAWLANLGSPARPRLAWIGLSAVAIGGHLFGWSQIVLGWSGMPRRYAEYLPDVPLFAHAHRVGAAGALLLVAGLLVLPFSRFMTSASRNEADA
jgi:xanthosine utilization system XapX-like protein